MTMCTSETRLGAARWLAVACCLFGGCATPLSGKLDGQQYVSRSGDTRCSFSKLTAETTFVLKVLLNISRVSFQLFVKT